MVRLLAGCAGLVGATTALLSAAVAQPAAGIEWKAKRNSPSRVQLTLEYRRDGSHNMWTTDYDYRQLPGLSAAQFAGGRGPARFVVQRPAGRLDCAGTVAGGRGQGTCAFSPDEAFAALLEQRGFGRPTWHQSLSMAFSRGIDRPLVESLGALRTVRPSVEDLVSMGVHGVTADFIRSFARWNFPAKSAGDLVSLRIHGADPEWIEGVGRISALRRLSASELVSLRIHGARPEWLAGMASALGPRFARLSSSDLTSMRIHGARPEMVAAFVQLIGSDLSGSDITSLAVHGVNADFIRRAAAAGYRGIPASELVSLRLHGLPRRASRDD